MRRPRLLLFAATMIGASALAVGVADAKPLEREHYSGTDTFSFDDCGFTIDAEIAFSGLFMLKEGKHGDPTPYLFDNYRYQVTFIDTETGEGIIQQGNGLYKDLHITNVEGTIYQFEGLEAGQPFSIRTLDGDIILRDYGLLRTTFVVDTKGDTDLDNDEFVEGSFEVLADRGAHPGFYFDEEMFCATVEEALAA